MYFCWNISSHEKIYVQRICTSDELFARNVCVYLFHRAYLRERDSSETFMSNWRCQKSFYLYRQKIFIKYLKEVTIRIRYFYFADNGDKQLNYFLAVTGVVKLRLKEVCRTGHLQKWQTRIYIQFVYVSRPAVSLAASGMLQCSIERILFQRHECGES